MHRLELETVLKAGHAVSAVDGSAGNHELVVREVEVFFVARARDFEEALGKVDVDGAVRTSVRESQRVNELRAIEPDERIRSTARLQEATCEASLTVRTRSDPTPAR